MKKIILFGFELKKRSFLKFSFLFFLFFFSLEGMACKPFTEFFELNKELKEEINRYELKIKGSISQNTNLFKTYEWSEKRKYFQEDIKTSFPSNLLTLFNEYEENVKSLDNLFESVEYDENSLSKTEKEELKYLSMFHLYVISDLFPNMISFRKYNSFVFFKSVDSEMKLQGYELIQKIKSIFAEDNLKKCKDEKGQEEKGLEDSEKLQSNLSKAAGSLNNSEKVGETEMLKNPEQEIPGDAFLTDYEGDEIKEENANMNLRTEIKGNKLIGWIKNFFGFFAVDKQSDKTQITSELYSKNIVYIGAKQKNLNITKRYTEWQNDRNFWINRTREISGVKTDVFTQKFKKITNLIEKINKELDKALDAISTTCRKQKIKLKCWGSSNSKPK